MQSNDTYWESLIGKFLSGNCQPDEERELQQWIDEAPENRKKFQSYQKTWNLTETFAHLESDEVEEGWNVVEKAIQQTENKTPKPRDTDQRRWITRYMVRAAAVLIILVLSGITLYRQFTLNPANTLIASEEMIRQHMLPDGSVIWLNEGTEIRYRTRFRTREVHLLRGEAFFDVQKDPDHPFQVLAPGSKTTVLGTRFNLRVDAETRDIDLFVEEGKVAFEAREKQETQQVITRGESAVLHSSTSSVEKKKTGDINTISWKTHQLVFDHQQLRDVIPLLEDFFDVHIEVSNPGTLDCHFRSTFDKPTLSEVLETLKISLNASITFSDSTWVITAPTCQNPDVQ